MEKRPAKKHSFLSANSLKLREDDIYGFTPKSIKLTIIAAVSIVVIIAIVGIFGGKDNSRFILSEVSEGDFKFTAQYYKDATVQSSRDTNYLVGGDAEGQEVTLWVSKLKSNLSCGKSPSFHYKPGAPSILVRQSCYSENGLIFASDVEYNGHVYQINMTSQKPIKLEDAKAVFGSVTIEE